MQRPESTIETTRSARGTASPLRRWLPGGAVLVALAVLPFLGSLDNPLLLDDRILLQTDWLQREAGPSNVFLEDYWHGTRFEGSSLYRPVTILVTAWNLRLGGPAGVRAVNVALHAMCCLAVAAFLLGVFRNSRGRRPDDTRAEWAAWTGAAVFAVHPLASESVLLIVGRAEILSALWGLLAFRLAIGRETRPRLTSPLLAGSCLFLLLALCSKESSVCWIAILAIWVLVRRGLGGITRSDLVRFGSWLAVFALFMVLRSLAVGWGTGVNRVLDNPLETASAPTRIVNAVMLLARYLFKMIWPRTLSVEYGLNQIPTIELFPVGLVAAVLIAAVWTAVLVLLWRRSRAAAFLWLFLPAGFAVTSNLAFPIGTIFAERLAYLPLVAACGLAGLGITALPAPRNLRVAVVVLLLAAGAARSAARTADMDSVQRLREATVRASPNSAKARALYGDYLLRERRDPAAAIPHLETAVEIYPAHTYAHQQLAEAYLATGRRDLARKHLIEARRWARWHEQWWRERGRK